MFFARMHSKLFRAIRDIVLVCAKPKMVWIHTARIVARMAHRKVGGIFPRKGFITHPMSLLLSSLENQNSITVSIFGSRPLPTFTGQILPHSLQNSYTNIKRPAASMSVNKPSRRTLHPSVEFIIGWRQFCWCSAPTFTQFLLHALNLIQIDGSRNNIASITQT